MDIAIIRAFKQFARRAHPDKGGSKDLMQQGAEAKDVLLDPIRRAEYDEDGGHSPSQQQQQQQQQQRGYNNQNSSPNARYHNIIAQPHMEQQQQQALPSSRPVRGGPTIVRYSEEEQPSYEKPYLLVDIRDR